MLLLRYIPLLILLDICHVTAKSVEAPQFKIDHTAGKLEIAATPDSADINYGNDNIDLMVRPDDTGQPFTKNDVPEDKLDKDHHTDTENAVKEDEDLGDSQSKMELRNLTNINKHQDIKGNVTNIKWKGRLNHKLEEPTASSVLRTLEDIKSLMKESFQGDEKTIGPDSHSRFTPIDGQNHKDEYLDAADAIIKKVEMQQGETSSNVTANNPEDTEYVKKAKEILNKYEKIEQKNTTAKFIDDGENESNMANYDITALTKTNKTLGSSQIIQIPSHADNGQGNSTKNALQGKRITIVPIKNQRISYEFDKVKGDSPRLLKNTTATDATEQTDVTSRESKSGSSNKINVLNSTMDRLLESSVASDTDKTDFGPNHSDKTSNETTMSLSKKNECGERRSNCHNNDEHEAAMKAEKAYASIDIDPEAVEKAVEKAKAELSDDTIKATVRETSKSKQAEEVYATIDNNLTKNITEEELGNSTISSNNTKGEDWKNYVYHERSEDKDVLRKHHLKKLVAWAPAKQVNVNEDDKPKDSKSNVLRYKSKDKKIEPEEENKPDEEYRNDEANQFFKSQKAIEKCTDSKKCAHIRELSQSQQNVNNTDSSIDKRKKDQEKEVHNEAKFESQQTSEEDQVTHDAWEHAKALANDVARELNQTEVSEIVNERDPNHAAVDFRLEEDNSIKTQQFLKETKNSDTSSFNNNTQNEDKTENDHKEKSNEKASETSNDSEAQKSLKSIHQEEADLTKIEKLKMKDDTDWLTDLNGQKPFNQSLKDNSASSTREKVKLQFGNHKIKSNETKDASVTSEGGYAKKQTAFNNNTSEEHSKQSEKQSKNYTTLIENFSNKTMTDSAEHSFLLSGEEKVEETYDIHDKITEGKISESLHSFASTKQSKEEYRNSENQILSDRDNEEETSELTNQKNRDNKSVRDKDSSKRDFKQKDLEGMVILEQQDDGKKKQSHKKKKKLRSRHQSMLRKLNAKRRKKNISKKGKKYAKSGKQYQIKEKGTKKTNEDRETAGKREKFNKSLNNSTSSKQNFEETKDTSNDAKGNSQKSKHEENIQESAEKKQNGLFQLSSAESAEAQQTLKTLEEASSAETGKQMQYIQPLSVNIGIKTKPNDQVSKQQPSDVSNQHNAPEQLKAPVQQQTVPQPDVSAVQAETVKPQAVVTPNQQPDIQLESAPQKPQSNVKNPVETQVQAVPDTTKQENKPETEPAKEEVKIIETSADAFPHLPYKNITANTLTVSNDQEFEFQQIDPPKVTLNHLDLEKPLPELGIYPAEVRKELKGKNIPGPNPISIAKQQELKIRIPSVKKIKSKGKNYAITEKLISGLTESNKKDQKTDQETSKVEETLVHQDNEKNVDKPSESLLSFSKSSSEKQKDDTPKALTNDVSKAMEELEALMKEKTEEVNFSTNEGEKTIEHQTTENVLKELNQNEKSKNLKFIDAKHLKPLEDDPNKSLALFRRNSSDIDGLDEYDILNTDIESSKNEIQKIKKSTKKKTLSKKNKHHNYPYNLFFLDLAEKKKLVPSEKNIEHILAEANAFKRTEEKKLSLAKGADNIEQQKMIETILEKYTKASELLKRRLNELKSNKSVDSLKSNETSADFFVPDQTNETGSFTGNNSTSLDSNNSTTITVDSKQADSKNETQTAKEEFKEEKQSHSESSSESQKSQEDEEKKAEKNESDATVSNNDFDQQATSSNDQSQQQYTTNNDQPKQQAYEQGSDIKNPSYDQQNGQGQQNEFYQNLYEQNQEAENQGGSMQNYNQGKDVKLLSGSNEDKNTAEDKEVNEVNKEIDSMDDEISKIEKEKKKENKSKNEDSSSWKDEGDTKEKLKKTKQLSGEVETTEQSNSTQTPNNSTESTYDSKGNSSSTLDQTDSKIKNTTESASLVDNNQNSTSAELINNLKNDTQQNDSSNTQNQEQNVQHNSNSTEGKNENFQEVSVTPTSKQSVQLDSKEGNNTENQSSAKNEEATSTVDTSKSGGAEIEKQKDGTEQTSNNDGTGQPYYSKEDSSHNIETDQNKTIEPAKNEEKENEDQTKNNKEQNQPMVEINNNAGFDQSEQKIISQLSGDKPEKTGDLIKELRADFDRQDALSDGIKGYTQSERDEAERALEDMSRLAQNGDYFHHKKTYTHHLHHKKSFEDKEHLNFLHSLRKLDPEKAKAKLEEYEKQILKAKKRLNHRLKLNSKTRKENTDYAGINSNMNGMETNEEGVDYLDDNIARHEEDNQDNYMNNASNEQNQAASEGGKDKSISDVSKDTAPANDEIKGKDQVEDKGDKKKGEEDIAKALEEHKDESPKNENVSSFQNSSNETPAANHDSSNAKIEEDNQNKNVSNALNEQHQAANEGDKDKPTTEVNTETAHTNEEINKNKGEDAGIANDTATIEEEKLNKSKNETDGLDLEQLSKTFKEKNLAGLFSNISKSDLDDQKTLAEATNAILNANPTTKQLAEQAEQKNIAAHTTTMDPYATFKRSFRKLNRLKVPS